MTSFEPHSVKALVFDTFGTVVDWRGSIIREGETYWRVRGVDTDWAKLADAWRGGYGPAMNRVRSGDLGWTKLDTLHRIILDGIVAEHGLGGLDEDDREHLNKVWHRLDAWPDAVPALVRLHQRFVLGPLSNGNFSLLTNLGKHAGLPWDCILSTELCGHYKPDPETYRMAYELLDLEPAQVMMVAAHTQDLEAAKREGLRTAYVHRPLEGGPGRERPMPDAASFDVVADGYDDLARALLP
ncbi:MAG TPA: haloacid dehalogenase type II [Dehalococcoidia bacterium]|nr:haloacid dehalogenase type II [Dehalococcoidia bacterium]